MSGRWKGTPAISSVGTERKPAISGEAERPASGRGGGVDVGVGQSRGDRGTQGETGRISGDVRGIRPLEPSVGVSPQQSGLKVSYISIVSSSNLDAVIFIGISVIGISFITSYIPQRDFIWTGFLQVVKMTV